MYYTSHYVDWYLFHEDILNWSHEGVAHTTLNHQLPKSRSQLWLRPSQKLLHLESNVLAQHSATISQVQGINFNSDVCPSIIRASSPLCIAMPSKVWDTLTWRKKCWLPCSYLPRLWGWVNRSKFNFFFGTTPTQTNNKDICTGTTYMHGSRIFLSGGGGGGPGSSTYFTEGVQWSYYTFSRGGGVQLFPGGGPIANFYRNPYNYNLWFSRGVWNPYPPLDPHILARIGSDEPVRPL